MKRQILNAGGNCLCIRGRGNFPVKCSTLETGIEAVVADLGIDVILGLDFFERHSCCIDIQRSILTIDAFLHTLLVVITLSQWTQSPFRQTKRCLVVENYAFRKAKTLGVKTNWLS